MGTTTELEAKSPQMCTSSTDTGTAAAGGSASTSILKKWLREHKDNPYPTPLEKKILMEASQLTRSQLDHWFTNARQRYVRPKHRRGPNPNYSRYSQHITTMLGEWLVHPAHVNHPYPSQSEQAELLRRTGLSKRQLQNWFTNARKRRLTHRLLDQQRHLIPVSTLSKASTTKKRTVDHTIINNNSTNNKRSNAISCTASPIPTKTNNTTKATFSPKTSSAFLQQLLSVSSPSSPCSQASSRSGGSTFSGLSSPCSQHHQQLSMTSPPQQQSHKRRCVSAPAANNSSFSPLTLTPPGSILPNNGHGLLSPYVDFTTASVSSPLSSPRDNMLQVANQVLSWTTPNNMEYVGVASRTHNQQGMFDSHSCSFMLSTPTSIDGMHRKHQSTRPIHTTSTNGGGMLHQAHETASFMLHLATQKAPERMLHLPTSGMFASPSFA